MGAQKQAVLDIASGRVERPKYPLPEWVSDTLAYYDENGLPSSS
jgi:hypothetical protein